MCLNPHGVSDKIMAEAFAHASIISVCLHANGNKDANAWVDERQKGIMNKTERNQYIAEQVKAGRTFVDIAKDEQVGLTATRVRTIAIEMGVHKARHYGRHSGKQEKAPVTAASAMESRNNEILDLVRKGYSYKEIGDKFGLTRARIGMIVKDYGEEGILDLQHESRAEHKRKIVTEASKSGTSSVQLAALYGHTPKYWEKIARQNDVRIIKENGKMMRGSSASIAERNVRICEYLQAGHTQAEACEEFGLSQVAISGIALNNGIRRRMTGELLAERNKNIVADIENGMMERDVAEKYGLSVCSISLIYAGRNVEIKKHDDLVARNQAIVSDVESGLSRREVAERNHVSIQTVNAVLGAISMEQRRNEEAEAVSESPVVEWPEDDNGIEVSVSVSDAKPSRSRKARRNATEHDSDMKAQGYMS